MPVSMRRLTSHTYIHEDPHPEMGQQPGASNPTAVVMPDMNGYDFCAQVKSMAGRATPVLCFAALSNRSMKREPVAQELMEYCRSRSHPTRCSQRSIAVSRSNRPADFPRSRKADCGGIGL